MAKHNNRVNTEKMNRTPRLSYHSQQTSFMSESGGEITELMSLDESEGLLSDKYGCPTSIHVISGRNGTNSNAADDDGTFNSKLISPAVTIVGMTGGLLSSSDNNGSHCKGKAGVNPLGEQATLNAIGRALSILV